jgi:HlyD family secretion protein
MKKRYIIAIVILVLIIIGAVATCNKSKKDEAKKDFDLLKKKTIENKQLISGKLASSKEVNIKSELAGIIEDLYVQIGDPVKKGQAIAKIKILPDPKNMQDADRQLSITKANLERIQANYQRNKTLFEKDVISRQEYELSKQEYHVAETEYQSAIKYKRIVKQGFSNSTDFVSNIVYSTTDGIVLDLPVKIGGSVVNRNTFNEGTTIATIADMNEILFKGQVNEKDLINLHKGLNLKVKINALQNKMVQAELTKISPKGVDVGGITKFDVEAKLILTNEELSKIKSGFTATAELTISKKENVWAIQEKYIQYAEDTAFVQIKDGESFKRKNIKTGLSDGQFIEIINGLKQEDKIVSKEDTEDK